MACCDINKCTPPRKSGRIPLVSTRFILSMENKRGDVGRNGRTHLARPNYQARTETGKFFFPVQLADHEYFLFQLTTSRIGNLTRLIHTMLCLMTIQTYIRRQTCDTIQGMGPTNKVKTVHQASLLDIEREPDRLGLLSPTHGQRSQQQSG